MSRIAKHIDLIIDQKLKGLMKSEGFNKNGRNFHLRLDASTLVLNVQASSFNDNYGGNFTVNLGVFFPEIHAVLGRYSISGVPKESDCSLRKRIGYLMPGGKDFWWETNVDEPVETIGEDLSFFVQKLGLPWLKSHSTIELARREFAFQAPFVDVAAAICLGEKSRARQMLAEIVSGNNPSAPIAKRIAALNHIDL
ncbi:DUF4304 domain-containing protein [Porticoccaceae bacterium LTM1]|nr:DUF4304 domain-containing protein [Porticoccaceae bacterium LTM1]